MCRITAKLHVRTVRASNYLLVCMNMCMSQSEEKAAKGHCYFNGKRWPPTQHRNPQWAAFNNPRSSATVPLLQRLSCHIQQDHFFYPPLHTLCCWFVY